MPKDNYFIDITIEDIQREALMFVSKVAYLRSKGLTRSNILSQKLKLHGLTHRDLWPNYSSNILTHRREIFSLDLTQDCMSYLFGILVSDGHLYIDKRKDTKGAVSIEQSTIDEDILIKLQEILPWKSSISRRSRVTNFGKHESTQLKCSSYDFRQELIKYGFVPGRKSLTCTVPTGSYNEIGFWRGMIDGDGSLGMTSNRFPFISLITTSESIADAYKAFLHKTIGYSPLVNRNTRDKAYNIIVIKENAVVLAIALYTGGISLNRKSEAASNIKNWRRC